jgi:uncharacterized membrane protein
MNRTRIMAVTLLALGVGVGAYAATRAVRSTTAADGAAVEALMEWLAVPTTQRAELRQHDPDVGSDLRRLRGELTSRRSELAAALDDPRSSSAVIEQRVEAVISATAAVERRVLRYLLTVRDHLSADQQRRLFALCARNIREGGGPPWRQGRGPDGQGRGGGGRGRGWGGGWGPTSR